MHPPLDRPHPDCQAQIEALRDCHATSSKWKVWACNQVKDQLDLCFREEKRRTLEVLNKNLDETKSTEQAQAAMAMGQTISFAEYLNKDPQYARDLEKERQKQNGWWDRWFRVR